VDFFVHFITHSIGIRSAFQTKSICTRFMMFYFTRNISRTLFIAVNISDRGVRQRNTPL